MLLDPPTPIFEFEFDDTNGKIITSRVAGLDLSKTGNDLSQPELEFKGLSIGIDFLGITSVISISWFGNLFAHGIFFDMLGNIVPQEWFSVSYSEASKDYGFSEWDVYAIFIFWLPPLFLPLVFYFLYKGLGNKVSQFVGQYIELDPLITGLTE